MNPPEIKQSSSCAQTAQKQALLTLALRHTFLENLIRFVFIAPKLLLEAGYIPISLLFLGALLFFLGALFLFFMGPIRLIISKLIIQKTCIIS